MIIFSNIMVNLLTFSSIILPISLLVSSFFLLVSIWNNKRLNNSLAEDLERAQAEVEMVMSQIEFCSQTKKEKEMEIITNIKQKEALEKILVKAKTGKDQATIL